MITNEQIKAFEQEQQQGYAEYVESVTHPIWEGKAEIVMPFKWWAAHEALFVRNALKELYELLIEYDAQTVIEDAAQEHDATRAMTEEEKVWGHRVPDEWARVLGILEAARIGSQSAKELA